MGYLHPLDYFIGHGGKNRCGLKNTENNASLAMTHPSSTCAYFVQQQLSLSRGLRHNREFKNTIG